VVIAGYIEELQQELGVTSVKQHLSAIRMLFDYLVTGHIVPFNPAQAVQAPRYSATEGKTPILNAPETRQLLDSIDITQVWGLRNRALIGVLVFSCARVSAVVGMKLEDYFAEGKEWKLRLHEKRSKLHVVPAHHLVIAYLDAYIAATGLGLGIHVGPLLLALALHKPWWVFNAYLVFSALIMLALFAIMMGVGGLVTRATVDIWQRTYALFMLPWIGIASVYLDRHLALSTAGKPTQRLEIAT